MSNDEYDYDTIPARVLNVSSRNLLSRMLNPVMEIPTSKYICKDYRGLAELMNFDYMTIKSFEATGNPTKKIFEEWEVLPNSTIGKLKLLLEEIERYDVIEDMQHLIEQDVRTYLSRNQRLQEAPLQVAEISSGPKDLFELDDPNVLTVDDINIRCQNNDDCDVAYFDAYVCYAEKDAEFVYMLTEYLERPEIGIKLCLKDRNLMPGVNVYEAIVKIIDERCNRMLVILSPEFLQSEECKFQTRYATGLAISQLKRKLIPLVYKPCEMPSLLRFVSALDFSRAFVCNWAWRNLLASIKNTVTNDIPLPSPEFCPALYSASFHAYSRNSDANLPMLPAPSQSKKQIASPQPSISFPPSSTYSLSSIPSVSSIVITSASNSVQSASNSMQSTASSIQSTANSTHSAVNSVHSNKNTSTSRSKFSRFVGKFSSSSSSANNSSSGNTSSGFQSQSDSSFVSSDNLIEDI
ncbi:myeloid differentiation primary response protein MyD88-like [Centruroides vittatus]|uniref:myeloid differentiation primary response protein MyD88-like n=1 Tax=Centruroides vittatus TaxID=120091 RepID=UPI00350F6BAE